MKRSLKKYPTGGEYKEMYPNIPGVYIKDSRKVRATTGKKIKPTRDLVSGYYRQDVIDSLARTAIERGINPYRAIAQGLAETNLGFTDENIGHVLYGKGENPYSDMMDAIKEGDALAAKRGKTKEEDIIQGYNRYGKLTPNTEKDYHKFKSKAFYGVPIPKEGLDMDKNPLYGKHILDLQKNVLEKSPEVRNIVQKYQYPRPKQSETEQMVGEKWKPTLYPDGGTTGEDFAYDRWRRSLPENLQSESPSYNLRGYWESLGKPEKFEPFNYDLYGGEYDGSNGEFLYHGFSRNPETGEILKGKTHPTLNMALNDKDAEGNVYLPYMKDRKIFTKKYGKGGTFLTAGNEYHRIYKNADGDIMVNHPKEDKGKWDTINLTDKAGAKTVADGVAATEKWHRENPYGYGGSIFNYPDGGLINNTMKKRTLSKTVYKYGGKLPQHGTGATVGSLVGAGIGALLAPATGGTSLLLGASLGSSLGSSAGSLAEGFFGSSDSGPDEKEMQRKQNIYNEIKYGPKQENPYVDVTQKNFNFPYGGVIDQHMANPNAELELEETFQTPDGTVGRVDGPSHDNGGIEVNLPEGTKIFSDRLKYKNGRTYAQITKPITTKIAKLEKKLQDNPQDVASANTVYLLNQQLDHYFDDQETNKSMKEIKRTLKMANGGMIKRADGSYSRRGLWDNIRANKGSGKKPTKEMLEQERKIKAQEKAMGGYLYPDGGNLTTQDYITIINQKWQPANLTKQEQMMYAQEETERNKNKFIDSTDYYTRKMMSEMEMADRSTGELKEKFTQNWKKTADNLARQSKKNKPGFDKMGNPIKKEMGGYMYAEGGINNPGFRALPEYVQEKIIANMKMGGYMYPIGGKLMNDPMFAEGGKLPKEVLMPRLQAHMSPAEVEEYLDEYGSGGYTVRKTNERKGKTHVVIGPDGTKKYFGDPKMGEKGKSKYGKEAFYARHKKNLDKNPYFRAYARATWQEGGTIGEEGMNQEPLFEYKDGGIYIKPENRGKFTAYAKAHGKGVQEMASHIMANKEDYSPTLVKRANFARNAAKWKHEHGGLIHYPNGGPVLGQINPRTGKAFSRDEVSTYYDFADMLPTPFGMEYGGLDSQGNQRFGNYNQLSLPSPVNPQETISPRFPQRPQPGALAAPSPVNAELTVDPMAQLKNTIEFQAPGEINIDELDLSGLGKTTTPATRDFSNVDDTTLFGSPTFKPTPNLSGINVKDNPPGGPTTKPESWASRNMGTIGQVGAGLAGAALRAYNLSKVKAPEKLSSLDFSSSMYNPDLVDYSANINAANRAAISAMDEAQRGFGSSAAAQAFKNKARLNQLETTGKIYQGQENVNKQLLNEARQRNQQIRMQEQAANQDIARQNMENAYNYNVWKQQQKNQIIQDLIGTTGNVFGGMQKFRNDTEMANILAKARENEVNIDALPEEVQLSYFRSLSPDQQATFNQKRARLGRTTFEFGGMIREFKDGGIHIKPENRGKFTATKKRTGKSTEELTHSKNPLTRKRAIFAQNAKKWAKK